MVRGTAFTGEDGMDVWNLYRSDQQGLITHLSSRLFGPFKQTDQDFKSRNGSEA